MQYSRHFNTNTRPFKRNKLFQLHRLASGPASDDGHPRHHFHPGNFLQIGFPIPSSGRVHFLYWLSTQKRMWHLKAETLTRINLLLFAKRLRLRMCKFEIMETFSLFAKKNLTILFYRDERSYIWRPRNVRSNRRTKKRAKLLTTRLHSSTLPPSKAEQFKSSSHQHS